MDTVAPTSSPYTWTDAEPVDKAPGVPTPSMDGGPQVSQPVEETDAAPVRSKEIETARAATVRRVATAAAGVGLVAAAVLGARGLRGANAKAGENVIDYDD